ncbi:MAG: zinc metalloprotease HtpX [Nanoarchaeota archaeon]|nr:zinc metalloprotease HtpX [Nanoarchaeota archaeon]
MANQLKTVALLGLLSGILLGVGYLIGGFNGLTIGLIIAVVMNFGSYFFSDKIVLFMYKAKLATEKQQPELYKIVREVTHLAKMPMPKVYIIPTEQPNAFATGRNPKHSAVACTEGIMKLLTKEELKGVIAHEVAHIKNRDILIQTIAATIAAVISYVGFIARWGAIFGGMGNDREGGSNILQVIVLGIITPIIAMMIQLAISRSREYLADETGAKTIHNPLALASALEKLERGVKSHPLRFGNKATSALFIANPFTMHGMMSLLSTHPPMDERIKRLKAMK